jgi:hypothetical protein
MGRLLSRQGALREAEFGGAESGWHHSGSRNIAAGDCGFQPHHHAQWARFRRGGKMRLAAPQKTIYNQPARDGTRRACGAVFSSKGLTFHFGWERRRVGPSLRGPGSASNE